MADFWKRIIEARPELIGTTVYFSPTKKSNLACILRDDGTVSPATAPDRRFVSIVKLANGWKEGHFTSENGTKFPKKIGKKKLSFNHDFFFGPERQQLVGNLFKPNSMVSILADAQLIHAEHLPVRNEENPSVDQTSSTADTFVPRREKCPGFNRRTHQAVVEYFKWDSSRSEFSPVRLDGDRCWSISCKGEVVGLQKICWYCKKTNKLLYQRRARTAKPKLWYSEQIRIISTPNRWLTGEEKIKKLEYKWKMARSFLKKKTKECRSLKRNIELFRPKDTSFRVAVRSAVKTINREQQRIQSPICHWMNENGDKCDFNARSINELVRHVKERHFSSQLEANTERPPWRKEYRCEWYGCSRDAPFGKFDHLRKHLLSSHTGNGNTENGLSFLKEQLINLSRAPSGRRFGSKTTQVALKNFRSLRSWERMRKMSQLPLPSARTVIAWKNSGGVKSGIDWTVLSTMAKIRRAAPELRHGVLSFDEVYVSPKKQLQTSSGQEFGWADNAQGQLAKTVLVFHFTALFSKKRFAVSIAWFGCGVRTALNTDTLEYWLMDVLLALERFGFRAHALSCDGHEVNRTLQERLVASANKVGLSGNLDHVVVHPATSKPEARLFLFSDPSHVIKRFRNCFFNRKMAFRAGSDNRKKKDYLLEYETIRWDDIVAVQQYQSKYARVDRRLTKKHLELDNFSKMNVQTAVDIFSEAIEAVLVEKPFDPFETTSTRYYLRLGRDLWLRANDRRVYRKESDTKSYFDGLSSVAQKLTMWHDATIDSPDRFLTTETFEDAMLLCNGIPAFMQYVWDVLSAEVPNAGFRPTVISQDGLEQTFGALRQRGGGTQNITVYSLAFNLRSINCNILNDFMQSLNIE